MHLVLFGGNSTRNQPWLHELEQRVGGRFDSTYAQDYQHWQSGEGAIDFTAELRELRDRLPFRRNYGVVAKSIGCVLTAKALEQGILRPQFLLLMGLPLGVIQRDHPDFAAIMAKQELPITLMQNLDDPVASSEAANTYLSEVLSDNPHYRFVEEGGDTHDYTHFTSISHELQVLRRGV